jgi:hypothetical protein
MVLKKSFFRRMPLSTPGIFSESFFPHTLSAMGSKSFPTSLLPRYIFEHNETDVTSNDFMPKTSGASSEKPISDRNPDGRTRTRGGVARPFPVKLYSLLESNDHEDIISWQANGRSFIIHNPKQFVESVMPKYFRQTQFRSFQRQLNLYDFKRVTEGPYSGGYYHTKFMRGEPGLCKLMTRVTVKCKPRDVSSSAIESSNVTAVKPLLPCTSPYAIATNCQMVTTPRINEMFPPPPNSFRGDYESASIPMHHQPIPEPFRDVHQDQSPNPANHLIFPRKVNEFLRPLGESRTVSEELFDDLLSDDMSFSLELSALDLDGIFDHEDESDKLPSY